jgi:hypothetical protein
MTVWESDHLIVVLKQGNACGAKGVTSLRKGERKHSLTLEFDMLWVQNRTLYQHELVAVSSVEEPVA